MTTRDQPLSNVLEPVSVLFATSGTDPPLGEEGLRDGTFATSRAFGMEQSAFQIGEVVQPYDLTS
jgi:hypothetical protein